jgi:hypothetical protein
MDLVTTKFCSWFKHINNHYLSDILHYFTPYHGQFIVNTITNKMNKEFQAFMLKNPLSHTKFGIIAHSLGGICWYARNGLAVM